ncbi:MAG TPA: transcriptional regulator, partial [Thermoanaerobaculia bacterium]|nr:transcriptional regulator [Thermoanaerobaculia bacterium]
GQGADRILEECVRHGKPFPDFSRSDDYQVWLTLEGDIKYEGFLRFIESVGQERLASLDAHDFLILGVVVRGKAIPVALRDRLPQLLDLGIVERIARGKIVLSHRFYPATGPRAAAIQKRDTARERNKADLFKLITENQETGVAMEAMLAVLPSSNRSSVKRVLDALRREGRVHPVGTKRNVRWYPGPAPEFGSGSLAEGSK